MQIGTQPAISPNEAIRSLLARLARPARLLVAVSGGSDSLGLLLSLARHPHEGITLLAVTVDHGLREASAQEAAEVSRICQGLGIPHATKRWLGDKPATGVAAAAREARYRLLCEAADEVRATAILTGHTLDDQSETVTMRAARASEPDAPGLAGMAEAVLLHRRHWLLRPFLRTRREEIRIFLNRLGQDWLEDPSNADRRSERVRTRLALAEKPAVLLDQIDAVSRRRHDIADSAAEWLAAYATVQHSVLMRVPGEGLSVDPVVLRYALSTSIAILGGREQGPASLTLDKLVDACRLDTPWKMTAGRVLIDRRRSGLYLCRENRSLPSLTLNAGEAAIWDGRFRVINRADEPLSLVPTRNPKGAAGLFEEAPPSVALRAARVLPPDPAEGSVGTAMEALFCTPLLAPFDRFLPQFDLSVAAAFAKLMGCDDFAPVPIEDSVRKR